MKNTCFVIVSDAGESWALEGDQANPKDTLNESGTNALLPRLLADGWQVASVTEGSGSKDEVSYWLVLLTK